MFTKAFQTVEHFVSAKNTSAAVALVGFQGKLYGPHAFGSLSFFPNPKPARTNTVFDLASLTKVVATTTIALKLWEEGIFSLDDKIGTLTAGVPNDKGEITIRQLLTHTSGLPAVFPLYKDPRFKEKETAWAALFEIPLSYKTGTAVEYSCVGFIILGLIMEQLASSSLAALFEKFVAEPLALKDTCYNPPQEARANIAYTEWDWAEKEFLQGTVHDENARALGGISGNAGLFGTALDLGRFCEMLLQKGSFKDKKILQESTINLLFNNYSPAKNQPRTLGWLLPSPKACSAGELISPRSVGHTGFTGTSIWLDFRRRFYGILLTNRVHPSRQNQAIIALRPKFYQAICQAIDAHLPWA
ncbi:MAG TPA: beta-lactamase family protein [Firmicutes bacterium]|nr:beta-lactamase family protein [Bacillota bacterium]